MKKILTRFFSLMLAAATALSATAGPLSRKTIEANSGMPGLTAAVAPAPRTSAGKTGELPRPRMHKAGKHSLATAATAAELKSNGLHKVVRAAGKAAGMPKLAGSVIWSESDNFASAGLYTVPTNDSEEFTRLLRYANAQYGGVLVDNAYYTCSYFEYPGVGAYIFYTGYDMTTGKEFYEASSNYYTYSMTYDATTETVYAIANIDRRFVLVKVTFNIEQNRVLLDPVDVISLDEYGLWNSIACDSKGQLWAIYSDLAIPENEDDPMVCTGSTLYKIDKNTAAITKVGETGFDSLYASDAIFDPKTDRLFWTVSNASDQGFLTEVDTTTGNASVIYVFPGNEEVCGLAILIPEAEDDAPAVATDLRANFADASLSGSIDFKAPASLFDGTPGSGNITYTIAANGEQIATGTTTFGSEVSAKVTVPAPGFYTFTVRTANEAGQSPTTEISAYVGAGTPEATSVTASYSKGVMNVSWLPVTGSINGGYIDTDAVTYTVTRYPENIVVAQDIAATSFSEALSVPDTLTTYSYAVVATYAGLSSAPARSNTISLGTVVPPFTATFENSLDGFNVVDANGDGQTWTAIDGRARIIYNKTLDMDDWLISPAIKLSAGTLYNIAAQLSCGQAARPERIEIKLGTSPDPDNMTTVLLEPTVITQIYDKPLEWSTIYLPKTDGNYYIGFHGISDKNTFTMYVDNFSIGRLQSVNGPAPVSNLQVVPGENGDLTATISFTTPSTTLSGDNLDAITKIDLLCDGSLVNTWNEPATNTALTYTDNLPEAGYYTYTVIPYSSVGSGGEVSADVYVGIGVPAAVDGVKACETGKPGEVTIIWNAVTMTEDSIPLDPSLVQYRVNRIVNSNIMGMGGMLKGTSYTYQAVEPGYQEFLQYAIVARTEGGFGNILNCSLSSIIPAGTPYDGLTLSNQEDVDKYLLGINSRGGGAWAVYDNSLMPSQDGDNRMFAMYAPYENDHGDLYTGLISLASFTNPTLTFYTFNIGNLSDNMADINEITVSVRETNALEFKDVKTVVVSETGPVNSWNRVVVDLSAYVGKTIQLNFYSIVKAASYTVIDNIKIGDIHTNDLAVMGISAPDAATAGNRFPIDVTITNDGIATATNYAVEVYADNKLVVSQQGPTLNGGASADVEFELTMSPFADKKINYYAKVVLTGDENMANNQSNTIAVTPIRSTLPAVGNLAGTETDTEIKLTWNAPDLASIPADAITEDFENGLPFTSRFGEWIFVDKDGVPVDGFSNIEVPNIINGVTKGSFWIWDTNDIGSGNSYFQAHSGTKYLFALYRSDMGQADEWAISPELNGDEQTISFYAKSYSADYPEEVKVAYSTGSIEPDEFTAVKSFVALSNEWTRYEFSVPEGAKRFAINSCAANAFMLMVDDVTYIPAGAPRSIQFESYDVYRDGQRINNTPVTACDYVDKDVEEGKTYEYAVVAVYDKGASAPSDALRITYNKGAIDEIGCGDLSIATDMTSIVVSGAQGLQITVYAVDGKTIFAGKGSMITTIPVQQGVYVVKAGSAVKTVSVR